MADDKNSFLDTLYNYRGVLGLPSVSDIVGELPNRPPLAQTGPSADEPPYGSYEWSELQRQRRGEVSKRDIKQYGERVGQNLADINRRAREDPRGFALGFAGSGVIRSVGGVGGRALQPRRPRASTKEIQEAARRPAQTEDELRKTYVDLGLSSDVFDPSPLARRSLVSSQPVGEKNRAILLKQQDLKFRAGKSPEQMEEIMRKRGLPSQKYFDEVHGMEAARVKEEIGKAEAAIPHLRGGDPGTAANPPFFDLSPGRLNIVPRSVDQYPLPRMEPTITPKIRPATSGGAGYKRLLEAARRGGPEAQGWYNLEQFRHHLVQEFGEVAGMERFKLFVDSTAASSPRSQIPANIRIASYYYSQVLKGLPLPERMRVMDPISGRPKFALAGDIPPPYSHFAQITHAQRVREFLSRLWDPVANPKPISFAENLKGNWVPTTVDVHEIRNALGLRNAQGKLGEIDLLPGEYSVLEGLGTRVAGNMGLLPAQRQAATWIGGGAKTGLKSPPVPLLSELNRRINVTSEILGMKPVDAYKAFMEGKISLYKEGGAVTASRKPDGSLVDKPLYDDQRMIG